MKILIIEDNLIIAEDIKVALTNMKYEVVGVAHNKENALMLLEMSNPEFVLVDIMLEDNPDGIDIASVIREKYKVPFLFLTSHGDPKTVSMALETKPNGYLMKPFERKELFAAIEVAVLNHSDGSNDKDEISNTAVDHNGVIIKDSIFVKDGHIFEKVKYDDILYIKSEGNYLDLYTTKKRFVLRNTIKKIVLKLDPANFFQCHRSYVLNLNYIDKISSSSVFIGDKEIPLGKDQKDLLLGKMEKL